MFAVYARTAKQNVNVQKRKRGAIYIYIYIYKEQWMDVHALEPHLIHLKENEYLNNPREINEQQKQTNE